MFECESVWDVVRWAEFELSIPVEFRTTKVVKQAKFWFHREIETIINYVTALRKAGKPYYAYFSSIAEQPGSSQMIANFSVKDLSKTDDPNKINWHMQNTSQWVYAGGFVIDKAAIDRQDERVVSTHH